jgi:hypothetical protein
MARLPRWFRRVPLKTQCSIRACADESHQTKSTYCCKCDEARLFCHYLLHQDDRALRKLLKWFRINLVRCRGVAQPGSAPALGAGGREFESRRPDQLIQADMGSSLAAAKFAWSKTRRREPNPFAVPHRPSILRQQQLGVRNRLSKPRTPPPKRVSCCGESDLEV